MIQLCREGLARFCTEAYVTCCHCKPENSLVYGTGTAGNFHYHVSYVSVTGVYLQ